MTPGGDGRRTFASGDGLRAGAAMAVLAFHAAVVTTLLVGPASGGAQGAAWDVLMHLNVGVIVFFVLSGYLVGGPFVRAWLGDAPPPQLGRYLGRRLRRIVPAFWVVSALALLWFGVGESSLREVLLVFGFAQVYDWSAAADVMRHAWTLDAELAFYLLLPAFAVAFRDVPRRIRPACLAAVLGAIVVIGLLVQGRANPGGLGSLHFSPFGLGLYFVPGLVLAAVEPWARGHLTGTRRGRRIALLAALAAAVAFAALTRVEPTAGVATAVLQLVVGAGAVGGALVWEWATGRAALGLDHRVPAALGRWSYGIYLIHAPVTLQASESFAGAGDRWGTFGAITVLTLVVTIPASWACWTFVERPALRARWRRAPEPAFPH